jgi:hypothetical protein
MGTLLLTILGDIIAGVVLYGITEGSSRSGGNQTVIINNAFFSVPEIRFSSRSSSEGDEVWEWLFFALFVFAMIVVVLVGLSAIYVQYVNLILNIGFWGAIVLAVIGGVLLAFGIIEGKQVQDWSIAQLAFYSLILCAAIGGLVWLIYATPNAPEGYGEIFATLQQLDLHDSNWTSKAIEIGMGDEFFTMNSLIIFIALQAIGILPMLITIILVIYIQVNLAKAIILKDSESFSIFALIGAPVCATISALFLGVFG